MTDEFITQRPVISDPIFTDVLVGEDDPGGTPITKQFPIGTLGIPFVPGGRLTLTTGTPVTTSDVASSTNVYYTPYMHNCIQLWNGSAWQDVTFTEKTLAIGTVTSGLPYDVFGYLSAGTLALEKLAWTNGTTRATAITLQDGRYCKSGDKTRLYLGTFYTISTTQTCDTVAKRFLWNMYNRSLRPLKRFETTASWAYTTATFRQANAAAANQVDVIIGLAEDNIHISLITSAITSAGNYVYAGIGEDSITAISSDASVQGGGGVASGWFVFSSFLDKIPAVGYHYYSWLERGSAGATFFAESAALTHAGLQGFVRG